MTAEQDFKLPLLHWTAMQDGWFWYCVRAGRIPTAILCDRRERAEAMAYALNLIERGDYITCAYTPKTDMLCIPRIGSDL